MSQITMDTHVCPNEWCGLPFGQLDLMEALQLGRMDHRLFWHYFLLRCPHPGQLKFVSESEATINALANGTTDNTAVLQTLLDEIRDAGGGELYLPGDSGNVYASKGLWVPSNCRIISEGAVIKSLGLGPRRNGSPDGDPIYADMLMLCRQADLGFTAVVQGVTIEGVSLDPGTRKDVMGIGVFANSVRIRDLEIKAGAYDGIYVGERASGQSYPTEIWVQRVKVQNAQRNNISIVSGVAIWIEDSILAGCTGVVQNPSMPGEQAPGCGIELEPNALSSTLSTIFIARNRIYSNAGAGIGLAITHNGDIASAGDFNLLDNVVFDNGKLPQTGDTSGVGTTGGVYLVGGQSGGGALWKIRGNSIKSQARGAGITTLRGATANNGLTPLNAKLIITENDLRSNPGGARAIPELPAGSVVSNNVEA